MCFLFGCRFGLHIGCRGSDNQPDWRVVVSCNLVLFSCLGLRFVLSFAIPLLCVVSGYRVVFSLLVVVKSCYTLHLL